MLSFLTDEQIVLIVGFFAIWQELKTLNEKFQMQDSFLPAVVGREFLLFCQCLSGLFNQISASYQ